MMAMNAAALAAHQKNLERYCRLLATDLTDLERDFLHRRIAETRAPMEQLGRPMTDPWPPCGGGEGIAAV